MKLALCLFFGFVLVAIGNALLTVELSGRDLAGVLALGMAGILLYEASA